MLVLVVCLLAMLSFYESHHISEWGVKRVASALKVIDQAKKDYSGNGTTSVSNLTTVFPRPACFIEAGLFPQSSITFRGVEKIYVIHWSKLDGREAEMKARLNRVLPSSWEEANLVSFVNAFDSDHLSQSQISCLTDNVTAHLTLGVLSVTAKHYLAYHDMLLREYQNALIMEDDVDFRDHFGGKVEQLLKELPRGWSNCFVSGCVASLECRAGAGAFLKSPPGDGSNCAYGYLISAVGAKQMWDMLPVRTTPDFQMNLVSQKNPEFHTFMTCGILPVFERPIGEDGLWKVGSAAEKIQKKA